MTTPASPRRMALHTKIFIGLSLGLLLGTVANFTARGAPWLEWFTNNVAQTVGQVFLRMLFMVVIPLVFTSICLGVASLGDLRRIGRIGAKTLAFFLATTALAAAIGLTLVNTVRPGERISPELRDQLLAEFSTQAGERVAQSQQTRFGIETFVAIVPRNPVKAAADGDMLGLIFFALVFGIALTLIPAERASPVIRFLEGVADAVMVMIDFAMRLAPYGVFGLIFSVASKFGFDVLKSLLLYVVTVLVGLALHQFGVLSILARVIAGVRPMEFFRRIETLMVTAFGTSSSNATIPTTLRTAEEKFGVPKEVAGFVIPLGATMNMNGTALFEGVTVLFLAQVFGIDLSLGAQAVVVIMSVITAVGAAGVPSGSIPLLVMVLGMVGVPPEGIALVLGVDRILDMCRTVPNVTGDLLTSIYITKSEGLPFHPVEERPRHNLDPAMEG
jgi:DAACS family dicarboxylate/amino acid:cation (Na+ or H+) symporter